MDKGTQKAKVLLEALPYIKEFHKTTIVVKYGGSLMVQDDRKEKFARDIVLLKYIGLNPIIVHGGGKEISKWMQKVGKDAVFIDGMRVTDSETMEITEMVLSGKINNEVVSLINKCGGKAVGLSGKDANMFTAQRIRSKNNEDLGHVGTLSSIDTSLPIALSDQGYIPVISSVGVCKDGQSLNLNADNVAAGVASYLGARKLVYLTDVDGVMIDGELLPRIEYQKAKELLNHPQIQGGMLPKLEFALSAIERGVPDVHILNGSLDHAVLLEIYTDTGVGTMITKNTNE